ncbi:DUF6643 family protein [Streptomyces sp. I05A-00742]|uniref:DUF6643 family protein n=1 Tax=Streptomyces sp. I05A-00742 TaxID=2732853 RepID=UPI001488A2EB|nr:DUF6643 family protein [Streptomyces sp. I05A-00742]
MTSPRSAYGSGYYTASSFPDTPIYDSLVAERGTPQIAPIRVSAPFDGGSQLPALPALPSGHGSAPAPAAHQVPQPLQSGYAQQPPQYGQGGPQPVGLQHAPAPYIPQQASAPRGYPGPQQYQQRPPAQAGPGGPGGYDGMRPVAPRPAAQGQPGAPGQYDDPYQRPYPGQGGY